jgi:sec-independent protein translocase protein TatA
VGGTTLMISDLTMPFDLAIPQTLAFGIPGGWEWGVILVIGLLIFGRRLPEVGRSVGKSIVEFKKGIKGIEHEIESETSKSSGKARLKDDSPDKARSAMYENAAEGSSKDA